MSASDQTSIQVELVSHCQDERVESTRGQIRIHDLKTFYASINPILSDMMDLIETWIWWDIYDAAELVRFEQKLGKIQLIRQGRLTDELRKRYALLIQSTGEGEDQAAAATTLSDQDILLYEFQQVQRIRHLWSVRRADELGYMFILKRDELTQATQGELIHKIAAKVREYDAVESNPEISEEIQHRYALDLKLPPQKVTRQDVMDFLQQQLVAIEREMLRAADTDAQLGPPYNFKARQLEQMEKWIADLEKQLGLPEQGDASSAQMTPVPTV
jgi:hypothetical protein